MFNFERQRGAAGALLTNLNAADIHLKYLRPIKVPTVASNYPQIKDRLTILPKEFILIHKIIYLCLKTGPYTDYRVIVKAFTTKNEGEPSDQIAQRTDVGGPSAPAIVNLTCHSQESITIRWRRPYEFYNTIDFYIIKTRLAGQDTHRDIRINASAKELETAVS